ncbi:chaperone modulator CbpM [Salegentibacter sp. F14]
MNLEDLIPTEEICTRYKVEETFIHSLSRSGLIKIITVKKSQYVPLEEITNFEKLRRLHYELDINLEGLEAIDHLLRQLEELQHQNRNLKNRLGLYE